MRTSGVARMAGRNGGAAAALLALIAAAGCGPREPAPGPGGSADLADSLAGLETLASTFPPVGDEPLGWPADHGAHGEHFTESWLVAGLLVDGTGGRHGFQLVLQRIALRAEPARRDSAWAARSAWYGRFVVETPGASALVAERISRDALGLAGATRAPAAAWLEDWRLELAPDARSMKLRAGSEEAGVDLDLALPTTPPAALEAEARRGYWWPGLRVSGTLRRQALELEVEGAALVERWWGRAPPVGRGQLALVRLWQLGADGNAVRCEQLRRRGGGGMPLGTCSSYPAGRPLGDILAPAAAERPAGPPLRWRLELPAEGGALLLRPMSTPDGEAAEWSGLLLPDETSVSAAGWGLLALSNFAAP